MDTRQIFLFCGISLALALGLAAALFPLAAVSEETLSQSRVPQAAEDMPDIDVGEGFGTLPGIELLGYYVDNPPAKAEAGAAPAPRRQQFGGC